MSASRRVLMTLLGGLAGVLLAWLLLHDGLKAVLVVAILATGVVQLVQEIQRGKTRA